jgi:hypothetical protein
MMSEGDSQRESEPDHIQLGPQSDGTWAWVIWYSGDSDPRDREGSAPTLELALKAVNEVCFPKRSE